MADIKKRTGSKRGATTKGDRNRAVLGFIWLGAGLLVGLFIAFLVFLQNRDSAKKFLPNETAAQKEKKETTASTQQNSLEFDFYKRLPKMDVNVPKSGTDEAQEKSPRPTNKTQDDKHSTTNGTAPVKTGTYMLQVGSFKRFEDADRHKANLAMLGISSKIVPFSVQSNETWHRVQIGPISNERELNDVRQTLSERHIEAILIKVRG